MVYERGMRIDKWLWFSRLSGSRSEAQKLCESRRLRLDGRVIDRSCATVRPGAILSFPRGDHVVAVRVLALAERRGPSAEARGLYQPLLPVPAAQTRPEPCFATLQPA
ncbi:MAG: RNA-binding S4 domain-containing protein [Sphingomonadaceae bacterium]